MDKFTVTERQQRFEDLVRVLSRVLDIGDVDARYLATVLRLFVLAETGANEEVVTCPNE